MPVTTSYPGIYIEELPSNAHTIKAAPTSITVFVGYTHPFKTKTFGKPVELFNFTDFETNFGGLYTSGVVPSHVAYGVNQFFLNGGSHAYVVGLQARYNGANNTPLVTGGTATIDQMTFTARELVDLVPMTVTVDNLAPSDPVNAPLVLDVADISIAYGTQVETFRGVTINKNPVNPADKANFVETRINGPSSLVTVAPRTNAGYGNSIPAVAGTKRAVGSPQTFDATPPAGFTSVFAEADFVDVFQADTPLDKLEIFNVLVTPGVADTRIWSASLAFAERRRAFAIFDPPAQDGADPNGSLPAIYDEVETSGDVPKSPNGAIYFPYLVATDPLTGDDMELPPSGYVAGIYSKTDLNRGVWKAPAGLETVLLGTKGVVERGRMTDMRQGTLNDIGVNCIRSFPGVGSVVFGARTLVTKNPAFEQWRYVPVRRMALFIEDSLYDGLSWAVFEPNDEPLWFALRTTVGNFMLALFKQGAFQGATPSQAFRVQCDKSTTSQDDINNGIVNIVVAFAPLKPAEFVVIKIAQLAGQVQS